MIEIRKPSAEDAEAIYMMYDAIVDDTEGRTEASPKWTKGVYPGLEYIKGAIERGEMFAAFDDGIGQSFRHTVHGILVVAQS